MIAIYLINSAKQFLQQTLEAAKPHSEDGNK